MYYQLDFCLYHIAQICMPIYSNNSNDKQIRISIFYWSNLGVNYSTTY
jgi:hypothetical protein